MWCSDLFNNLMIPFESLNIYRIKINARTKPLRGSNAAPSK